MEHIVEKYALENALRYKGKANSGAVVGSVIGEFPDAKKDMKSLMQLINKVVSEVNQMDLESQESRLKEIAPELLEKKSEEKDIFSQFKPKGKVITAFPPEPSKYPHIGHAKAITVNHEFAKRNKGKFIVRFEDTNPELAVEEFYDIHLEDYEWLGIKPDEVQHASDFMEDFYELGLIMVKKGQAYVCNCDGESIKKSRMKGIACEHRNQSLEENEKAWKKMFQAESGYILRAKIDLEHKNSTMRDPTLFRILDIPHCRTKDKYRVWPTYDFENAAMDGISKITHRFRSKEFEMRSELQRYLQKLLGLPITETYEFARFKLEGVETSGRVIREEVKTGNLIGWDDPSLATLRSLKRRGFLPEAIKSFVLSTGLSKNEAKLTWDDLILHNKRLLDEKSDRYSFVEDPVKITIEGAPEQEVELFLHPEHRRHGRKFTTGKDFYMLRKDFDSLKDKEVYRFMECLNFTKEGKKFRFHSKTYDEFKGKKIMNFLPVQDDLVEIEVLMPDKKVAKGLAEPLVKKLKEGDIIQFERFGFCRLDSKNSFWFTHS